jgi:hypothetical protein
VGEVLRALQTLVTEARRDERERERERVRA